MEIIDNIEISNYSDQRTEGEIEADLRAFTDSNPEINPSARERAIRNTGDLLFNGSLSINMAAIAEQIPIIIGRQKRDLRGHESEQAQYNLKVSFMDNKRLTALREQLPSIYKTNLDVVREMFLIGRIVLEAVRLSPEFRETERYKYFADLFHQDEIESLASVAIEHLRKRAAFLIKDVIDRDQFIEDVNTVIGSCSSEVRSLVQPVAEKLMSEHGLDEEKEKLKEKDKKQRQRDKQKKYRENQKLSNNLRVVGGTEYQGDNDIDE